MKHAFSDRLRFCRRQQGLTQEQLAEAMGWQSSWMCPVSR